VKRDHDDRGRQAGQYEKGAGKEPDVLEALEDEEAVDFFGLFEDFSFLGERRVDVELGSRRLCDGGQGDVPVLLGGLLGSPQREAVPFVYALQNELGIASQGGVGILQRPT